MVFAASPVTVMLREPLVTSAVTVAFHAAVVSPSMYCDTAPINVVDAAVVS